MKRRYGPRESTTLTIAKRHIPSAPGKATALLATESSGWKEVPTQVLVIGRIRAVYIGPRSGSPEPLYARWVKCRVPGEKLPRDIAAERFMGRPE